jgi:hypothetical protein
VVPGAFYDRLMALPIVAASQIFATLLAGKVWHYWLSFALLIPIALLIVGMAVLYVVKVVATKHPRQ